MTEPAIPDHPAAELRLLGTALLCVPGQAPVPLAHKDAAMLAFLALDGPRSRTALCALLWPDSSPQQSAASLRQRLSRLHKACGVHLLHAAEPLALASGVSVDALNLHSLSAEQLMSAGELLAGIAFADQDELDRWLVGARARVADWLSQALAAHAEALALRSELRHALPLAARVVELTPLGEHGWRRLMRLHYLRGDRAAALAAFDRLSTLLMDELGLHPSAETLQLWRTIDTAVPSAPLPRQPVPASVMLPPVMVGRDDAWHQMTQAWQQGRAVVLLGDAGMGKSRLLQEFVHGREGAALDKARPGDEQVPYAVLGRVLLSVQQQFQVVLPEPMWRELAAVHPALGQPWPKPSRPDVLRHAVRAFMESAADRGLRALVLDDLHDADLATLEALRWMTPGAAGERWRLAVAMRPPRTVEHEAWLKGWLNDSQAPVQVELAPLTPADLAALLATMALPDLVDPAVTQHLYRHAGGHPLYTLATLQHVLTHGRDFRLTALPDPPSVRALLDARLSELPATAAGCVPPTRWHTCSTAWAGWPMRCRSSGTPWCWPSSWGIGPRPRRRRATWPHCWRLWATCRRRTSTLATPTACTAKRAWRRAARWAS